MAAAAVGGAALGAGAGAALATPTDEGTLTVCDLNGISGNTDIDVFGIGPDLASSLAAALAQRKGDMGDSDDEESEDEWD